MSDMHLVGFELTSSPFTPSLMGKGSVVGDRAHWLVLKKLEEALLNLILIKIGLFLFNFQQEEQ
jgi:hypothetical protein